jgi:hypothetical protein
MSKEGRFGKIYECMFERSLAGSGSHIIAIMAYIIAKKSQDGIINLQPKILAGVIGDTPERMQEAIDFLCQPDDQSENTAEEGRRLLRVGPYAYRVVSHEKYRNMGKLADDREDAAERQRRSRAARSEPEVAAEKTEATTKEPPPPKFTPPTREELNLAAAKIGLPDTEVTKFVLHYSTNGWKVGRNKMVSWPHALAKWKIRWQEDGGVAKLTPEEEKNKPWWTPPEG